jgi:hypothetical protein
MRQDYFEWLYDLACGDNDNFTKLCEFLDSVEFIYTLPMDDNRYSDGISLRYRFGYECDIPSSVIAAELDTTPCSVFEMMTALALRIEEDIMSKKGEDRTSEWFMSMIRSLGLEGMNDDRFHIPTAERVIDIFLNRNYNADGEGGLFTIENRPGRKDLRDVEIWYQAMWYVNDILEGERI